MIHWFRDWLARFVALAGGLVTALTQGVVGALRVPFVKKQEKKP